MIENWYKIAAPDPEYVPYKDPWVNVDSSFIEAVAYFSIAEVLEIRLKNGNKYTFMDVPKQVYEDFLKSPSKGVFFNSVIRKNYTKSQ